MNRPSTAGFRLQSTSIHEIARLEVDLARHRAASLSPLGPSRSPLLTVESEDPRAANSVQCVHCGQTVRFRLRAIGLARVCCTHCGETFNVNLARTPERPSVEAARASSEVARQEVLQMQSDWKLQPLEHRAAWRSLSPVPAAQKEDVQLGSLLCADCCETVEQEGEWVRSLLLQRAGMRADRPEATTLRDQGGQADLVKSHAGSQACIITTRTAAVYAALGTLRGALSWLKPKLTLQLLSVWRLSAHAAAVTRSFQTQLATQAAELVRVQEQHDTLAERSKELLAECASVLESRQQERDRADLCEQRMEASLDVKENIERELSNLKQRLEVAREVKVSVARTDLLEGSSGAVPRLMRPKILCDVEVNAVVNSRDAQVGPSEQSTVSVGVGTTVRMTNVGCDATISTKHQGSQAIAERAEVAVATEVPRVEQQETQCDLIGPQAEQALREKISALSCTTFALLNGVKDQVAARVRDGFVQTKVLINIWHLRVIHRTAILKVKGDLATMVAELTNERARSAELRRSSATAQAHSQHMARQHTLSQARFVLQEFHSQHEISQANKAFASGMMRTQCQIAKLLSKRAALELGSQLQHKDLLSSQRDLQRQTLVLMWTQARLAAERNKTAILEDQCFHLRQKNRQLHALTLIAITHIEKHVGSLEATAQRSCVAIWCFRVLSERQGKVLDECRRNLLEGVPFCDHERDGTVDDLVVKALAYHAAEIEKLDAQSRQIAMTCEQLTFEVQKLQNHCQSIANELNDPGPTLLALAQYPDPMKILVDNVPLRFLSIKGCKLKKKKRSRKREFSSSESREMQLLIERTCGLAESLVKRGRNPEACALEWAVHVLEEHIAETEELVDSDDKAEQQAAFLRTRFAACQLVALNVAATRELWALLRTVYRAVRVGVCVRLLSTWRRRHTLEQGARKRQRQLELVSLQMEQDRLRHCKAEAASDEQIERLQATGGALSQLLRRACVFGALGVSRRAAWALEDMAVRCLAQWKASTSLDSLEASWVLKAGTASDEFAVREATLQIQLSEAQRELLGTKDLLADEKARNDLLEDTFRDSMKDQMMGAASLEEELEQTNIEKSQFRAMLASKQACLRAVMKTKAKTDEQLAAQRKRTSDLEKSEQKLQQLCVQAGEALTAELSLNQRVAEEAHQTYILVSKCFSVLQQGQPQSRELHSFRRLQSGLDVFQCSCALLRQVLRWLIGELDADASIGFMPKHAPLRSRGTAELNAAGSRIHSPTSDQAAQPSLLGLSGQLTPLQSRGGQQRHDPKVHSP